MAHKGASWLPHSCRIGDPHRCRAGGKIRSRPQEGQIGYLTPAVSGIPAASERGAKSEVVHKGANWLPHPCRMGDPHRFRAGGKIRSRPQVGKLATSPLPYRGSPPLHSGGQNQKWPKGCTKEGRGGRHGPRSSEAKRPLGAVVNKKKMSSLKDGPGTVAKMKMLSRREGYYMQGCA